jgi:peptide deformylase
MAVMNIREMGDPVLRSSCKPVEDITDKTIELLENMRDTMYKAEGIGLAAPQVGVLQRIFIVDVDQQLIEFINPEIVATEGKTIMEEACLSIPDESGSVIRAKKVKIKGYNREGKEIVVEADGLLSRALQHELDHLDGKLFVDKTMNEAEINNINNEGLDL